MTISLGETIGSAVRRHRERKGLSQAELARRMKSQGHPWHPMTVARTETGERPLRLDEAVGLAGILGISVQALYAGPPVSDPELDQYEHALQSSEQRLFTLESRLATVRTVQKQLYDEAMRAREKVYEAEKEYDSLTEQLRRAEEDEESIQTDLAEESIRLDRLRGSFVRLRRRKQQEEVVRSLRPDDKVNVTIENVEPAKTRFTKRPDGVIFELVSKDDEVVLTSQAWENEQIAKEQAAFFLDRYADNRRNEEAPED